MEGANCETEPLPNITNFSFYITWRNLLFYVLILDLDVYLE